MTTKTLLDLNADILHLILFQIYISSPTSACTFARVSKTTQRLMNPIIWRTIKIGKEYGHYYSTVDFVMPIKTPFLMRDGVNDLLSKTHLVKLVREIIVQNIGIQGTIVTDSKLARIIVEAKALHTFSWNYENHIGPESLAALEERGTDVELYATRRSDVYVTAPLDAPLLSSRLLTGLTHNIAWQRTNVFAEENDNDTVGSQFEEMSSILAQSKSIRALNFRLNNLNSITPIKTATPINIKAAEHFPHRTFNNIRSLDIPADYGDATGSPATLRVLTSLIISRLHKWKSVQELHLSGLHASYTFEHLKNRVPNLRKLEVRFPAARSNRGELAPELVAKFLVTLSHLEELKIRDMNLKEVEVVWPAILLVKHTLRSLDLYTRGDLKQRAPVFETKRFDELLINSHLTHLSLPVSVPTLTTWSQSLQPPIHLPTTLHTLKLTTHIPNKYESIFSAQYHYDLNGSAPPVPPVNIGKGKEIALGISKAILGGGRNCGLEELELCLVRIVVHGYDQTEEVKTSVFVEGGALGRIVGGVREELGRRDIRWR